MLPPKSGPEEGPHCRRTSILQALVVALHYEPFLDHDFGEPLHVARPNGDAVAKPLPGFDGYVVFEPISAGIREWGYRGYRAVVGDAEVGLGLWAWCG